MNLGRRLADLCLVAALLLLCGPRAWGSCDRGARSEAGAGAAGLDALDPTGTPSRAAPSGLPAAPCHGLRCDPDARPTPVIPRPVRHIDLWECGESRAFAAPRPSSPAVSDDPRLPSSMRADRLDRPPR